VENLGNIQKVLSSAFRTVEDGFGYYGLTGNYPALVRYRQAVIGTWPQWLARRGDAQGMPWERMTRLLQFYALPEARVVHSVYAAKP
jgi:hypothetical protein